MRITNDIVLDDTRTEMLIKTAKAFARTTYQGVILMDCKKLRLLYVSDNPFILCGCTAEEVLDRGLDFFQSHVSPNELSFMQELSEAFSILLLEQPIAERLDYVVSFDYHLLYNKHKLLVHQKVTPLALDQDGKVLIVMCVISYSARKDIGPVLAQKSHSPFYWEYSREGHKWRKNSIGTLCDEERLILLLSAQGYKMNEISERIYKSLDTVKFYKRRLFEKMEVNNITEALAYALIYRLI